MCRHFSSRMIRTVSVLCSFVLVLLLVPQAGWGKSKKSCRRQCDNDTSETESVMLAHDPLDVPLCLCLNDKAQVFQLYRWGGSQWLAIPIDPQEVESLLTNMMPIVCEFMKKMGIMPPGSMCGNDVSPPPPPPPPPLSCSDGSTRCNGPRLEICSNGLWTVKELCQGECQGGQCVSVHPIPSCADGTVRCSENRREECRSNQWVLLETCTVVCRSGQCEDIPVPVPVPEPRGKRAPRYSHNIIDRPLALRQAMFQLETGLRAGYAINEDDEYSWAHTHIPIHFAVGAFDFLQFGAGLWASLSEPSSSAMNTNLYVLAAPIPQFAIRAGMYFPDSLNSDEIGALFGLEGNYPVIPKVLALRASLDMDHFSQRFEGNTELKVLVGLRWSFVDQFYLGISSGIDKVWWNNKAISDYYGTDTRFPFDFEIGFTSRKQVDLVANFGWLDWASSFPYDEEFPDGTSVKGQEAQRYFELNLRVRF